MTYTIGQMAKRMGVTVPTLRFYDKEGLLPFVDRRKNGTRVFKDKDFPWLDAINCMKRTGMPIKDIRVYVDLCIAGDSTLSERLKIMQDHKRAITAQIETLERHMKKVDHKIAYYEVAVAAGTELVHKDNNFNCWGDDCIEHHTK